MKFKDNDLEKMLQELFDRIYGESDDPPMLMKFEDGEFRPMTFEELEELADRFPHEEYEENEIKKMEEWMEEKEMFEELFGYPETPMEKAMEEEMEDDEYYDEYYDDEEEERFFDELADGFPHEEYEENEIKKMEEWMEEKEIFESFHGSEEKSLLNEIWGDDLDEDWDDDEYY